MARAICARCGKPKSFWSDRCVACDYDPETEGLDAQVLSILLSTDRFDDPARIDDYETELEEAAVRLARGDTVEFEPSEVARVKALLGEGKGWSITDSLKMIGKLGLWLGTPITILIVVILLLNGC